MAETAFSEVNSEECFERKTDQTHHTVVNDNASRGGFQIEQPGHNMDIVEEEDTNVPPDGGWGWFVVLGSVMAHIIIGGLERSKGVIVLELLEKFEDSASATSWVASLSTGLRLILGPVASVLCNRFSVRQVVFVGGIVLTAGCLLSAFAPSLLFVHLSFGVVGGIGRALCYTPSVVIVGMYFDKRRGMAVGLATAGVGVGTFVLPSLTEYLFNLYGFIGAFILLGGYVFHMAISAMLYRPLDLRPKLTRKKKSGPKKIAKDFQENEKEFDALLERTGRVPDTAIQEHDGVENLNSRKLEDARDDRIPQKKITLITVVEGESDSAGELWPDGHQGRSSGNAEALTRGIASKKRKFLDIQLLKDPSFLSFCFTMGLFTLAFETSLVFLPALGESKGLSKTQAALLLSVMGVTDTIARFGSGVIFDRKTIVPYRRYLYTASLLLIAVITFTYPLLSSLAGFIVFSLIFGVLSGTYIAQISVIVVDLVGKDKLVSAFGITVWFQGIGSFIGPPIAGKLRDSLGNYDAAFYFGGAATFLAGTILMMSNIYFYCKYRDTTTISVQGR